MKNNFLKLCILCFFISNPLFAKNDNVTNLTTVRGMINLSAITNPSDGDVVLVKGFRTEHDGGGGLFVYYDDLTEEPVYNATSDFLVGYSSSGSNSIFNGFYDGMVVRPAHIPMGTNGRWIRKWNNGKLNIRWFGGTPGNSTDCSIALNTALYYAQRPLDNSDIFSNKAYTSPGKTIFFPSGKYYFKSAITDINYGVVIEGEGNMGVSDHGTHFWMQQNHVQTATGIPSANQSGYFRFLANGPHSSGGGFKNLLISVEETNIPNEDFVQQNVITLRATDNNVDVGGSAPALSKWTAENVVINCRGNALRAIYMRSYVTVGALPWRIRDISLINCWFAGNTKDGESVHAQNVSGLHVIGGFFSSGRGNQTETSTPGISIPGIFLGGDKGCYNTHLDGVDLTHAVIKIWKVSAYTNVDCRFGKLEIYDSVGKKHIAFSVTKQHILNPRIKTPSGEFDSNGNSIPIPLPDSIKCPLNSSNSNYTSNTGYKCYNNSTQIELDNDWD